MGVILHMAVFVGHVSEIYSCWVSNWFCLIAMAINLSTLLPSPKFFFFFSKFLIIQTYFKYTEKWKDECSECVCNFHVDSVILTFCQVCFMCMYV